MYFRLCEQGFGCNDRDGFAAIDETADKYLSIGVGISALSIESIGAEFSGIDVALGPVIRKKRVCADTLELTLAELPNIFVSRS